MLESVGLTMCGAEGQNRTVDTSLFRAVLYQLSYLGTETKQEAALLQNDRGKSRLWYRSLTTDL
jgi:hypothetical protein